MSETATSNTAELTRRVSTDCNHGEQERGGAEADRGRGALCEVVGDERGVDPRADRARKDHEVALQRGQGDHLTITSPSMSRRCSVQT